MSTFKPVSKIETVSDINAFFNGNGANTVTGKLIFPYYSRFHNVNQNGQVHIIAPEIRDRINSYDFMVGIIGRNIGYLLTRVNVEKYGLNDMRVALKECFSISDFSILTMWQNEVYVLGEIIGADIFNSDSINVHDNIEKIMKAMTQRFQVEYDRFELKNERRLYLGPYKKEGDSFVLFRKPVKSVKEFGIERGYKRHKQGKQTIPETLDPNIGIATNRKALTLERILPFLLPQFDSQMQLTYQPLKEEFVKGKRKHNGVNVLPSSDEAILLPYKPLKVEEETTHKGEFKKKIPLFRGKSKDGDSYEFFVKHYGRLTSISNINDEKLLRSLYISGRHRFIPK